MAREESRPAAAASEERDVDVEELVSMLADIAHYPADAFHRLELALVSHYRRHEADQEAIAVALTRLNLAVDEPVARERVDEILIMLQHVHDPFIH